MGAPGTGELFVNEFGYKQDATPGSRYTWVRLGAMYNNSTFHDFTKSVEDGGLVQGAIGPTVDGNAGFYLLADRQIWQPAPGSATTAYRGLYAGATVMYARPRTTPITQYYEGRLYAKAPFASRPRDLVSLVAYYQVNSPYLVDNLNTLNETDIRKVRTGRRPSISWPVSGPKFKSPPPHYTRILRRVYSSFTGHPYPHSNECIKFRHLFKPLEERHYV